MSELEYETLESRQFLKVKEITYKVTRKDKKMNITPEDVRQLVKSIETQASKRGETIRLMVRALNGMREFTLKGFDTDLDVLDFEEYFEGKVKDISKFTDFAQLEITIMKSI